METLSRRQFFGLTAGALVAVPALSAFDSLPIVSTSPAPQTVARYAVLTHITVTPTSASPQPVLVWLANESRRFCIHMVNMPQGWTYASDVPIVMQPDDRLVIDGPGTYECQMQWVEY